MSFSSLHVHTYRSNIRFYDSINRPKDLINKALKLGFSGIAFTDHEHLSDVIEILKIRDKISKEHPDFKIIFGNEIYLIDEKDLHNTNTYYHFILLAKDQIGWDQLRQLSSRAWERGYMEKGLMRVSTTYQDLEEIVKNNQGHIIASTACLGGFLPKSILDHNVADANNFIRWCIDVFGKDNFNLEIQPSDSEEQITVNKVILKFANHYNLPYIITTDAHYLDKEDFNIHSAFLNSKQKGDRETEKFYRFTYMMTEEEMTSILMNGGLSKEQIEIGFENTVKISNSVEVYDFRHGTIVPKIKIPNFTLNKCLYQYGDKYPFIKQYYDSSDEQDVYLMYQIEQGIINKKVQIDDVKLDRINKELDILSYISNNLNQSLSSYLNLTVNIVNIAWQVSLVGCGRGSACGFYINYLIGITQADPLKYNLPHWRFLNKERVELPDVDEDFQPEKKDDIIRLLREEYGEDSVLNCATFKTESLKSAILTCGRGLGYNNDDMQSLAASVPASRGKTYTLKQCLEGDEEQGFDPVPNFRNMFNPYPGLFEAVEKIEGLPTNASIHASALYVFNDGYLPQNSLMRAPNGVKITAFNMHDSDDMGALKMDVLLTDCQSKMAKCLELLAKDKQIEWQGSLRATYDKYLHPDVLDYNNPKMWKDAADGKIIQIFQFDTQVGGTCIKKVRPTNVSELAEINSIMRLQVEGDEQPIDRYVRFKKNIQEWYDEMYKSGLNEEEVHILEGYLKDRYGISGSQETLMLLVMDPKISNFTLGQANGFRKAIAKKIPAKIQENKELYFKKGHEIGTRDEFLNYIWIYCVSPQLGYAFSLNHTLPYSLIAVQEMNLASRFNPLYWACAVLCVDAGSKADIDDEDDNSEEIEDEVEEFKSGNGAINYKKIGRALGNIINQGIKVAPPHINRASLDFTPDIANNAIVYSLLAVKDVNEELANRIINNRPYSNMIDFYNRIQPTNAQMISLIKAGAFDEIESINRYAIMEKYLTLKAKEEIKLKEKMTTANIAKAVSLNIVKPEYKKYIFLYNYKKWIDSNQLDKKDPKRYILTDDDAIEYFEKYLAKRFTNDEFYYIDKDIYLKVSAFKKVYTTLIKPLMDWMNSSEGLNSFYKAEIDTAIQNQKDKYCQGDLRTWEFSSLTCYLNEHELNNINGVVDFYTLPELPQPTGFKVSAKNGKEYPIYDLCSIAGTVVGCDNTRHIVTLLTPTGIVDVKFYKEKYIHYNMKISEMVTDEKGKTKKTVLENSWFDRGNKLLICGLRRENMFVPRAKWENGSVPMVQLITGIESGIPITQRERVSNE